MVEFNTPLGTVVIEKHDRGDNLQKLEIDEGLSNFRPYRRQKEALIDIANQPQGWVVIARLDEKIMGYVTFHPPDEFTRWGKAHLPFLLEMGAIEVTPELRGTGLARKLLTEAFSDPVLEKYIVMSTEYYWHCDLKNKGMDIWTYQKMLENLFSSAAGMERVYTDDPEITSHPANMLMVRFGKELTPEQIEQFEMLRYEGKKMF